MLIKFFGKLGDLRDGFQLNSTLRKVVETLANSFVVFLKGLILKYLSIDVLYDSSCSSNGCFVHN